MDVLNNVYIRTVQRFGKMDRYGRVTLETAYDRFRGRLDRSTSMVRNLDGSFTQVAGTLMLPKRYELKTKDIITLDNVDEDQYTVFSIRENIDITGTVLYRTYYLEENTE